MIIEILIKKIKVKILQVLIKDLNLNKSTYKKGIKKENIIINDAPNILNMYSRKIDIAVTKNIIETNMYKYLNVNFLLIISLMHVLYFNNGNDYHWGKFHVFT